jgi:hypothetical protein
MSQVSSGSKIRQWRDFPAPDKGEKIDLNPVDAS